MSSRELKDIIADIDVSGIVKRSMRSELEKSGLSSALSSGAVNESYVATPKTYSQVTEYLSQKSKDAHVNLYKAAIESLNRVSAELDGVDVSKASANHSSFRSLKLDETFLLNSTWLHEVHFAGSFDPHSTIYMDSAAYIELERTWGTFDDWQREFLGCAMSCGNGWAVLGFNVFLKRYVNTMISNDSQDVMVGLIPIIALDMHEHAYSRDYLSDKRSYAVAMLKTLNWETIEERFNRCKAIAQVLK